MASSGTSAFYVIIFIVYAYTLWYDWSYVEIGHQGYAGKFKFLTFWNLVLQTLYFGLCVANCVAGSDVGASGSSRQCSGLQKLRDNIHATLAFPVGSFVVATFWAIYAIDRELVFPRALDSLIPPWMNHVMFVVAVFWALFYVNRELIFPESRAKLIPAWLTQVTHTTVLPILLVEKNLVYHHHPRRHNGIFLLSAFALCYLLWILWIAYAADLWVYPILRIMSGQERAIFIGFLLMFFISIYLVGEALTKFLWRKEKAAGLMAAKQK